MKKQKSKASVSVAYEAIEDLTDALRDEIVGGCLRDGEILDANEIGIRHNVGVDVAQAAIIAIRDERFTSYNVETKCYSVQYNSAEVRSLFAERRSIEITALVSCVPKLDKFFMSGPSSCLKLFNEDPELIDLIPLNLSYFRSLFYTLHGSLRTQFDMLIAKYSKYLWSYLSVNQNLEDYNYDLSRLNSACSASDTQSACAVLIEIIAKIENFVFNELEERERAAS